MASSELLLHPVRLRIVQAFLGERELTTSTLRSELPDVAVATLYRQVATLVAGGVLVVSDERAVRGTVERTYRLRAEAASVTGDDLAAMGPDEHRRAFMTFVAGLLADLDRYLDRGGADLVRDQVGYRQTAVHLDDEETAAMVRELRALVARWSGRGPSPGRTRRLLSTVLLPG